MTPNMAAPMRQRSGSGGICRLKGVAGRERASPELISAPRRLGVLLGLVPEKIHEISFGVAPLRGVVMKRAVAVLTVAFLAAASAHAQWLKIPTPGIPRTPDGKPNLSAPAPRTSEGRPSLAGLWKPQPANLIFSITGGLAKGDT